MKNFTDITFLLDRSGSMQSVINDVIGGYASFVRDQQRLGDNASLSLVQFDSRVSVTFDSMPIMDVNPVLPFTPSGSTALLDALGQTITNTGARLSRLAEADRPNKVVFIVMTDGEENASIEYRLDTIRTMIDCQRTVYSWDFVFMGANIDAFSVGSNLGVFAGSTVTYDSSGVGTSRAFNAVSSYTSNIRSGIDVTEMSLTNIYNETK